MSSKNGKVGIPISKTLIGRGNCYMEDKYYDELVRIRMERAEELLVDAEVGK